MQKEKPALQKLVEELVEVAEEARRQVNYAFFPASKNKPKWCQCNKCGKWHNLAP